VARGADVRIVRPDGADERALEAVAARDAAFTSDGALLYLVNAFADPAGRRNELIAFDAGEVRELARVEIGQDPRSAAVVPGRLRAFVAHREPGLVSVIDGRVIREDPKPLDRRRILCECTSGPCPSPNGDCVPLAVLVRGPGGGPGRVETCAIRKRLYSNEMLLELIWCLAERLDECCERRPTSEPETPPGPGVPPRSATRQGGQA
jgi:hypothetical protein